MHRQLTSLKKARAFSLSALLVGFAIHSVLNNWWPSVLITIGVALALRQCLLGKFYEAALALFVFIAAFFSYHHQVNMQVFWPVIFLTSAIFIIVREYLDTKIEPLDQKEEDLNHEIEEEEEDRKK